MDAIDLLTQEHERFRSLMEEIAATSDGDSNREELLERFRREISAHERVEEEIFYPALMEHPKAKEDVLEGVEEHHAVDVLLDELVDVPVDDERWGAKFTVIKENVEHHLEEEEGEMFDKARDLLDDDELEELGTRMEQRLAATLNS